MATIALAMGTISANAATCFQDGKQYSESGRVRVGDAIRACNEDGEWVDADQKLKKSNCLYSDGAYTEGAIVMLPGRQRIMCRKDGKWVKLK